MAKQKIKTHKGMLKRLKITNGKKKKRLFTDKSCNNHLLTNKGKAHKNFTSGKEVSVTKRKKIARLVHVGKLA